MLETFIGSHSAQAERGTAPAKGDTGGHFNNLRELVLHALRDNTPVKSDLLSKPGWRIRRHPVQMGDIPI